MVADLQIPEVRQERLGDRPAPVTDGVLRLEEVGLRVELQARLRESEAARQDAGRDEHGGGGRRLRPFHRHADELVLRQQLHDAFRPARGLRHEHLDVAPLASPADGGNPVAEAAAELGRRLACDVPRGGPPRRRLPPRAVEPRLVDGQRAERRRLREPAGGDGPGHLELPDGGGPRRRARGRRRGSPAAVPPTAGGARRCRPAPRRRSVPRRAGRTRGTRRCDPRTRCRRRAARNDRAGAPRTLCRAWRRTAAWPDRSGAATRCCRPRTPPAQGRRRRPGRGPRRLRGRRTPRASRPDRRG